MQMGQSYDQSAGQPMVQQQFVQAQMHMPQQHSVYSGSQPQMGHTEQNFGTYGDDPNMHMANVMRQNPPPTQKYISDSEENTLIIDQSQKAESHMIGHVMITDLDRLMKIVKRKRRR